MGNFQWILDKNKFLNIREINRLRKILSERKEKALFKGHKVAVRDWFIAELGLSTGLRVQEMADLKCGDIAVSDSWRYLIVRKGKGNRSRTVKFSRKFKEDLSEYLAWKEKTGEDICPESPLFFSDVTKSHLTKRAVQKSFKRSCKHAKIKGHSIHHLRHTYASFLYRASRHNLMLVQKQLGHTRITTTQVYAGVMPGDEDKALENLYSKTV